MRMLERAAQDAADTGEQRTISWQRAELAIEPALGTGGRLEFGVETSDSWPRIASKISVNLAGGSMRAIVQAIPELEARIGRAATVIGGLAVLTRLGTAYRATADLDTANRRATGEPPQLDVLLRTGVTRPARQGVWIPTPAGVVRVDVIEGSDAELSQLPEDETDRLAVLSHSWAIATATAVEVRASNPPEPAAGGGRGPFLRGLGA